MLPILVTQCYYTPRILTQDAKFELITFISKRRSPVTVKFKNPEAVEEVAISVLLTIVLMVVPVVTLFAAL